MSDRRSGQIIMLVGSLIAVLVAVIHMTGAGMGVKRSAGAFFFVWTIYALGVIGIFGFILSVRALRDGRALESPGSASGIAA